jgi:hypothetical protein
MQLSCFPDRPRVIASRGDAGGCLLLQFAHQAFRYLMKTL